jgi:hypothetical protein
VGWKVTDLRLDGADVSGGPRQVQGPARERRTGAAQRRRLTSERQRTLADMLGELTHSELKKARQLAHRASVLARMWHAARGRRADRTGNGPATLA